jgi:hypothetical protein
LISGIGDDIAFADFEILSQALQHDWVTVVDVSDKMDTAISIHFRRPIKQQDRQRLRQKHGVGFPPRNDFLNGGCIPLRRVIEEDFRELERVLHANAAVAKIASGFAK